MKIVFLDINGFMSSISKVHLKLKDRPKNILIGILPTHWLTQSIVEIVLQKIVTIYRSQRRKKSILNKILNKTISV